MTDTQTNCSSYTPETCTLSDDWQDTNEMLLLLLETENGLETVSKTIRMTFIHSFLVATLSWTGLCWIQSLSWEY